MRSKKTSTNSRNRSGKKPQDPQQREKRQREWPPSKGPAPAAMAERFPAPATASAGGPERRGALCQLAREALINIGLATAPSPARTCVYTRTDFGAWKVVPESGKYQNRCL